MEKTEKIIKVAKKFTNSELSEIISQLKTLVSRGGHRLGYVANKNLSRAGKVAEDWNRRLYDYQQNNYEKGFDGSTLLFVTDKEGNMMKDSEDRLCCFSKEDDVVPEGYGRVDGLNPNEKTFNRYPTDRLEEIQSDLDVFMNETFEIDFVEFDSAAVQRAFDRGKLEGVDLSALFGVMM